MNPAAPVRPHVPKDCSDGDPCSDDFCDPVSGECVSSAKIIDDGDACTVDSYDFATGEIRHDPKVCDDHDACTDDACDSWTGLCVFEERSCDDHDACTADRCDKDQGTCVHEDLLGEPCDDGDPCTENDTCGVGGFKLPGPQPLVCEGTPIVCEDGEDCTIDSCDPVSGKCVAVPDLGAECDDGNLFLQELLQKRTCACLAPELKSSGLLADGRRAGRLAWPICRAARLTIAQLSLGAPDASFGRSASRRNRSLIRSNPPASNRRFGPEIPFLTRWIRERKIRCSPGFAGGRSAHESDGSRSR